MCWKAKVKSSCFGGLNSYWSGSVYGSRNTIAFDIDDNGALVQRKKSYAEAAKEGCLIAADHLSFPGIGRIRSVNDQFIWMPVNYSLSGRTK